MRILLALLLMCLAGCMQVPPTVGGVLHHNGCPSYWRPDDFPLQLVVDRGLSPARQVALLQAVLEWNESVGLTVFTVTREIDVFDPELFHPIRGTVYVLEADIIDRDPPHITQGIALLHRPRCYIESVRVYIDVAAPDHSARLIWKHELGHALGLSHDPWQPSIMWRFVAASGDQIMENDINFIRWEMTHDYPASPTVSGFSTLDGGTVYRNY